MWVQSLEDKIFSWKLIKCILKCLVSLYQKPLCPLQPSSMFLICATELSLPSDPSDNVFSDVIMDCWFWYPHLCAENYKSCGNCLPFALTRDQFFILQKVARCLPPNPYWFFFLSWTDAESILLKSAITSTN